MQYHTISRPSGVKPVTIEVDGEPLGVVVPSDEGYRFLAVRYAAFAHDGHVFESVEDARVALGKTVNPDGQR